MEVLKELSQIVSLKKTRFQNDKMRALYKLAQAGVDEETAMAQLFREEKNPKVNYRRLKNRLINRLIRSLLFTPTEGKTDYNSVYNDSFTNFSFIKLLSRLEVRATAVDITENTLKKSLKYELTDLNFQLALFLSNHYAQKGEKRRMTKYRSVYEEELKKYQLESQARLDFYEVVYVLERQKKPGKELIQKLGRIASTPKVSYQTNILTRRAELYMAQINNDYESVIRIVEESKIYIDALAFTPPPGIYFLFYNKLIPALILRGEFKKANEVTGQCFKLIKKGYRNWHTLLIYRSILGFHTENYDKAINALIESKPYQKNIAAPLEEEWLLIEGYLSFLHLIGRTNYKPPFRLSKFLNEIYIYGKDKPGANASIIILRSIIYLAIGDRDKLIDSKDMIFQYTYKYLDREESSRANLMIRIIRETIMAGFDKAEFIERSKPHLEKLDKSPRTLADLGLELIPYERLYNYILAIL